MSSDQELLHAYCHHHDEAAFAQLVERHAAMVLSTCRRITRDHHDAEDAAQAAFVVLARKAPQLDAADHLAAWLHRVACFIAMRQRSARARRRRVEVAMSPQISEAAVDGAAASPLGERQQASWSLDLDLDAALAAVPDRYRQPLVLHYLEGRSCGEIASLMAISEDLVATRLRRGRERLRRRLRPAATLDVGVALAALVPQTVAEGMPPWRWQPTPRACALAETCLRTMWLVPAALASAFAAAIVLLGLGLAWGWTSAPAEDAPHASAATTPAPPALLQPRLSVACCPRWQERLLVGLERRVTLHAQDVPALAILDSIGRQCGLTMAVDLPPQRAQLPLISIDARGIPLQQVLDQIAQQTGTRYQLYAGSLLWRDAQDQAPWDEALPWQRPAEPMAQRVYRLQGLPAGSDAQTVVQDLEDHAGLDMSREGLAVEIFGDSLEICAPPTYHLTIEAYLASRWHQTPPAAATSETGLEADPKGSDSQGVMIAATMLDDRLVRPLGREVHTGRLRAALAEIAAASGIVIECAPDLGDPLLRQRPIPARLEQLAVGDAIALTLDGTGLHACMRVHPGAAAGSAAVLVVSRQPILSMATVTYHVAHSAPGQGGTPWDPEMLVDVIQKTIARESWSTRELLVTKSGVSEIPPERGGTSCWTSDAVAEETVGDDLTFTQCVEVQLEIERQLPSLSAALLGAPLPDTLTAPPPLELAAPQQQAAAASPILTAPSGNDTPRERL